LLLYTNVYGKVVGYVVVHEFVFWVRGLLGKVVSNGWVELILEINKTVIVASSWCSVLLYLSYIKFILTFYVRMRSDFIL
jgi:hypothetical protein